MKYRNDRAGKERGGHEAAVAAFMAEAKNRDPELVAQVFERHVVLKERALEWIREREVSAFGPSDEAGDGESWGEGGPSGDQRGDAESFKATAKAAIEEHARRARLTVNRHS